MTISAYTGLPGHGKSYGVVANVILPALRSKRIVYTNIPLNDELCLNDFGMVPIPFHIDDLIKSPNWFRDVFQSGSVIVIDEVWRLWPSGLKLTQAREGDKEFLAEHRHLVGENGLATEIVLVTQDLSQVASFARTLVENTFRVTKLSSVGLNRGYRVDVYFGPVTGVKPNPKNREREIFGKFSKEVYKYYKSHTKSQTGQAGDETRVDKRFNILGGFSIKLGLFFIIAIGLFIYSSVGDVKKGFGQNDNSIASVPADSHSVSSVPVGNGEKISQNNRSHTPTKPDPRNIALPVPSFLSDAKRLIFSHSISVENKLRDFFVVQFSDYSVTLDEQQLKKLGYDLEKISDCLVRVSGVDYSGFFMCSRQKEPSRGLGADLAATAENVTDSTL